MCVCVCVVRGGWKGVDLPPSEIKAKVLQKLNFRSMVITLILLACKMKCIDNV